VASFTERLLLVTRTALQRLGLMALLVSFTLAAAATVFPPSARAGSAPQQAPPNASGCATRDPSAANCTDETDLANELLGNWSLNGGTATVSGSFPNYDVEWESSDIPAGSCGPIDMRLVYSAPESPFALGAQATYTGTEPIYGLASDGTCEGVVATADVSLTLSTYDTVATSFVVQFSSDSPACPDTVQGCEDGAEQTYAPDSEVFSDVNYVGIAGPHASETGLQCTRAVANVKWDEVSCWAESDDTTAEPKWLLVWPAIATPEDGEIVLTRIDDGLSRANSANELGLCNGMSGGLASSQWFGFGYFACRISFEVPRGIPVTFSAKYTGYSFSPGALYLNMGNQPNVDMLPSTATETCLADGACSPGLGPAAFTLAALGDSYSSGEGAGDYDLDTSNRPVNPSPRPSQTADECHRSKYAWSRLLAAEAFKLDGVELGGKSRVDGLGGVSLLACSGADSAGLAGEQAPRYPDQLGALRALSPAPQLVTVTIGGNDIEFGPVGKQCVLHEDSCREIPLETDCAVGECANALKRAYAYLAGRPLGTTDRPLKETLESDYLKIGEADPYAHVFVVGYPQIVARNYDDVDPASCPKVLGGVGSWMTRADLPVLARITPQLDDVIYAAVQAVAPKMLGGISYVPTLNAFTHHWVCARDGSWVVPPNIISSGIHTAVHPTPAGQQAIAVRVAEAIREYIDG
jgi:lysophospholipase L1-like esterase